VKLKCSEIKAFYRTSRVAEGGFFKHRVALLLYLVLLLFSFFLKLPISLQIRPENLYQLLKQTVVMLLVTMLLVDGQEGFFFKAFDSINSLITYITTGISGLLKNDLADADNSSRKISCSISFRTSRPTSRYPEKCCS